MYEAISEMTELKSVFLSEFRSEFLTYKELVPNEPKTDKQLSGYHYKKELDDSLSMKRPHLISCFAFEPYF